MPPWRAAPKTRGAGEVHHAACLAPLVARLAAPPVAQHVEDELEEGVLRHLVRLQGGRDEEH
eukprot:5230917-Heterocapsa_arctica.AAC.1